MITDWQDIVHRKAKDHLSHTRNILQFRRFLWDILLRHEKTCRHFYSLLTDGKRWCLRIFFRCYQTRISDARLIFQVGHTEQMKLMEESIHHVTTLSVYPPIFGKRGSVALKCCALSLDNLHLMQGKTQLVLSLI